jgi:hypothetical protein
MGALQAEIRRAAEGQENADKEDGNVKVRDPKSTWAAQRGPNLNGVWHEKGGLLRALSPRRRAHVRTR